MSYRGPNSQQSNILACPTYCPGLTVVPVARAFCSPFSGQSFTTAAAAISHSLRSGLSLSLSLRGVWQWHGWSYTFLPPQQSSCWFGSDHRFSSPPFRGEAGCFCLRAMRIRRALLPSLSSRWEFYTSRGSHFFLSSLGRRPFFPSEIRN